MNNMNEDPPIRARIPADLDTPDQIVAGLSAHQLALLLGAAAPIYGLWQLLTGRIPLIVMAAITAPLAGLSVAVALGRRDGISLDRWIMAALAHRLRRHRLAPAGPAGFSPAPSWAPPDTGTTHRPGLLRLPLQAISSEGIITTGPASATVLVAASTLTAGLQTPAEQAVLLGGYTRWLHALTGPVQIVVSTRRDDLDARAVHLAASALRLPHEALAGAALAHAEFLLDLSDDGDRRTRTVTIACTATSPARPSPAGATSPAGAGSEAMRRAARTASALSALGSRCAILNGAQVTSVLTAITDPYGTAEQSWARTSPTGIVTGPSLHREQTEPGDQANPGWAGSHPSAVTAGISRADRLPRHSGSDGEWTGSDTVRGGGDGHWVEDDTAWVEDDTAWVEDDGEWGEDDGELGDGDDWVDDDDTAGWAGDDPGWVHRSSGSTGEGGWSR